MSWVKVESGARVNMDHIEEIQLREPVESLGLSRHRVLFYPPGHDDPINACEGSLEKCKYFLAHLDDLLQVTVIPAYELVKCQCECGCEAMIREGFEVCDECARVDHLQDYLEHLQEVKTEAA